MMLHKMGWFFQRILYPKLTWARYHTGAKVYLTFDDGPIPEVTEFVLDTLALYGAKATFFCVGDNVRKHPVLFERLLKEGHGVGNHTYNHLNGWQTPLREYVANVEACAQAMAPYCPAPGSAGKPLFRPPYGRIGYRQWKALLPQYEIIMWDVLSGDFSQSMKPETCLHKTLRYTEKGSIIVFHDNVKAVKNMYYALPLLLAHGREQGWQFAVL